MDDAVPPAGARKLVRETKGTTVHAEADVANESRDTSGDDATSRHKGGPAYMKRNTSVKSFGSSGNATTDESTEENFCQEEDAANDRYYYKDGGMMSQDEEDDKQSTVSSQFGFFDEFFDADGVQGDNKEAHQERDAWTTYTASFLAPKSSSSQQTAEDLDVLFNYNFPNPSQCFRLSNSDCRGAMELSSVISGFRIVQCVPTGVISAQFGFVFCYGSRSHFTWRRYSEFRELVSVLQYARDNISSELFKKSLKIWSYIEYKKKFFRNLSVAYLVQKAMNLNRLMQSVLFESPTPALLLQFVQSVLFVAI